MGRDETREREGVTGEREVREGQQEAEAEAANKEMMNRNLVKGKQRPQFLINRKKVSD